MTDGDVTRDESEGPKAVAGDARRGGTSNSPSSTGRRRATAVVGVGSLPKGAAVQTAATGVEREPDAVTDRD